MNADKRTKLINKLAMIFRPITKALFTLFLILSIALNVDTRAAQNNDCDVQIEILPDQYMHGTASFVGPENGVDKIDVKFNEDYMLVLIPDENRTIRLQVVNEDCQAYCKKHKRVRQLHSGDEKLVINLIKANKANLLQQISECNP